MYKSPTPIHPNRVSAHPAQQLNLDKPKLVTCPFQKLNDALVTTTAPFHPMDHFNFVWNLWTQSTLARLGFAAGRGGRPSVIVDKRMAIWLGNESDESVTWSGIEICGFGTGQFEPKIVRGGVRDVSGLAFRLRNDATLVSHNKTLMSVAHFMQHFAATSGLATIEIEDHVTEPMLQRPASCLQLSWC